MSIIDLSQYRYRRRWTARYEHACAILGVEPASSPGAVPASESVWHAVAYDCAYDCDSPQRSRSEFRAWLVGRVLAKEFLALPTSKQKVSYQ